MIKQIFACLSLSFLFVSCNSAPKNGLKVAATPVPHAQMLEFIKPDLKEKGIDLVVVVTTDYNMPNRALADKEVDANFFEHQPFLDIQVQKFGYPIESIAKIEIEPMGIYSKKIKSLDDLADYAKVAVPNDPSNEARALILFEQAGVITLDDSTNLQATVANIVKNPKNIQFFEIDGAMLPRSLSDVSAAAINTNYALTAGLSPMKDALILENKDSPYANVLVVRTEDEDRPDIEALKEAMTSEKMKEFILQKYQGAVLPAF